MKALFDEIVAAGEPVLKRLLAEEAQEDIDLEFKRKDTSKPGLTDGDRRAIGKTLSAFANSAGGLLVFGVDARPDAKKVDRLVALKPINEIDRVLSEVRGLIGHVLLPRHDGVRVELVRASDAPSTGYLAIYAERSERRPHMSKAPEDGRYYKRGGTNTFAMEHFDIEDAFKRMEVPELELVVTTLPARKNLEGHPWIVPISLGLRNVGEVLARFPYISILECQHAYVHRDGYPHGLVPRWKVTSDAPGTQLTGSGDDVIHVRTVQLAAHLKVPFDLIDRVPHAFGVPLSEISVRLCLQFGAEGHRGKLAEFVIPPAELLAAVRTGGVAIS